MRINRVSFSLLLPLLELTLWLVLVPTQAVWVYVHLRQMAAGSSELRLQAGEFSLTIRRKEFLAYALTSVTMRTSPILATINFPGVFIEAPVSAVLRGGPHAWHPLVYTWESWREISFPLFCLPAWWFAGRGLDAFLGWRRPRWWTLLIGTMLCAGFLTLLLGFRFGMSSEDRAGTEWLLWGCGLWTLMFAPFPAYWVRRAFGRQTPPIMD